MAWLTALSALLLVFGAPAAFAAWPSSGLPIATGPAQQRLPVGATAPGGDLLTFWIEPGQPFSLRAQRVTIQGTLAAGWPVGGRGVISAPAEIVSVPELVPDGAGGFLLAWYDYRSTGGARGIYGARVDVEAAVMPGWSPTGTPVCVATTAQGGPLNDLIRICPDGSGGAFVAWTDSRNTPPMSTLVYDVFGQHVRSDGTIDPAWPAQGLALTSGSGYKYPHELIADGAGGFWRVSEHSGSTSQIAATHHGPAGSALGVWTTPMFASQPRAVSDGAGGIYLAWRDCRDCLTVLDDAVYAMRLGPGAQPRPGWPVGGVRVSASTRDDKNPTLTLTSGGAAVIAWLETGGSADDEFMARRVEANGTFPLGWPAGGRPFATSTDILDGWPLIVPDGAGGAMFAFRRNQPNLFGSRVTAGGQVPPAFPDTGLSLCSRSGDQFLHALVSDGLNGAYVLWEDQRAGLSDVDVYAMRFTREGEVGSTTSVDPPAPGPSFPRLALSRPAPNPTSGSSALRLSLTPGTRARVEVVDLSGRSVTTLFDGVAIAATIDLVWDGRDREGRRVPAGLYLLRARAGDDDVARRIVRLE